MTDVFKPTPAEEEKHRVAIQAMMTTIMPLFNDQTIDLILGSAVQMIYNAMDVVPPDDTELIDYTFAQLHTVLTHMQARVKLEKAELLLGAMSAHAAGPNVH